MSVSPRRSRKRLINTRLFKVVSGRWQRRALFWMGGLTVGAAAVVLTILADWAQAAFSLLMDHWQYASLIVTPAGLGISVYLTKNYFPNSEGSGIPQAIAARHLDDQRSRGRLVSIRIAIGKIILTLLALLCGASVGREGPTVQVGASIMFAMGRVSPRRQAGLILAGASAGVAAAFNTPLAGIVFGIEEMSRTFEMRNSGLIISTVIAAGLTSLALVGNYTYFGTSHAMLGGGVEWLAVPICGVVGGLSGGLFSRIVVMVAEGFRGSFGRLIKKKPVGFAVVCGIAIALCGIASGGTTYGTGYDQVKAAIDQGVPIPWNFGILKFLATTLSTISGTPGGLFAPSLAVGAGVGFNIAQLFPGVPVGPIILLGMVSYFSGVVQAPITSFSIVTEMTNNHAMVVPLMAAALIGYAASRLICPEGVYHVLAKGFLQQQLGEGAKARAGDHH